MDVWTESASRLRSSRVSSLRKARDSGKLEGFIAEHEDDPEGDLDKLDAALKCPVQESGSTVPSSSSQGASDD